MAKIYGVELKKICTYRGHEGEDLIQCDVYMDGKKIGYFSAGDFGGEDTIDIIPPKDLKIADIKNWAAKRNAIVAELIRREEAFLSRESGANTHLAYPDGTELIYRILELKDDEQAYKKSVAKTGHPYVTYFYTDMPSNASGNPSVINRHRIQLSIAKDTVETQMKEKYADRNPRSFNHLCGLSDFIIEEPKK